MNISVVGKVSVGKSSFINSFYKNLVDEWHPIATMSIQRETFHPTRYVFGEERDEINYAGELEKNLNLRSNKDIDEFKFNEIKIRPKCHIASLIDFPGFDDSNDQRDCIDLISKNMGDITIFVTDAYRPFIDRSELNHFNKLAQISEKLNKAGIFNLLIVVVNKFDYLDDIDLISMFKDIKIKHQIFKWCSYATFKQLICPEIKNIIQKSQAVISKSDIDDLGLFLLNLPISKLKFETKQKFISTSLEVGRLVSKNDLIKYHNEKIKQLALKNYMQYFDFELPECCFDENNLQKLVKEIVSGNYKTFCKALLTIFNQFKIVDLLFFKNFIKDHFDVIVTSDPYISELQRWSQFKYWQLNEAYRVHTGSKKMLDLPDFPIYEIKYFKMDLMSIIEKCNLNRGDKVDFSDFM